jgi:ABC-2 type transport system permease protein
VTPAARGRLRALVRKEWRQLFRDPKTRRVIFVSPVIQLLLFGYAVTTDVRGVTLRVMDHDRTPASRALRDAVVASGHFVLAGHAGRPADLTAALDRGDAAVGLEIPPGFAADLAAGRGARVQVLVDGTSSNTATVAQGYLTRIVQRFAAEQAAARGGGPPGGVDLRVRAWYNPDLASRTYNVPAVLGALLFLMSLLLTALAVVRERELGTLEQLLVSPLTPAELMLGKTLPVAGVALIDLVLVAGIAILWFGVPFRGSLAALLLAATLFVLAALGLGLLISTVSRTQQEAFMAMFLLLLPALVLSGLLYPIHAMPAGFQALTLLNPVRWFIEIVRALFLKGSGLAELWPRYAALAAMAAAVLAAATWRFRRATR